MKIKIGIVADPFNLDFKVKKNFEKKYNVEFVYFDQKIKKNYKNLFFFLKDCSSVIAGTEQYNKKLLKNLKNLRAIFRVGIGTDSIDKKVAKASKIKIFNTPDAPSVSAAEYSLSLILNVIKGISFSGNQTKRKKWDRFLHEELSNISIGIIGLGRIGSRVLKLILNLPFKKIYANDINKKTYKIKNKKIEYCSKVKLLKNVDVLTLHVPLTKFTKNFLSKKILVKMKKSACIVNTSRGEVINENDLIFLLKKNFFNNIALDVISKEPYYGPLLKFENVSITPHNASMSFQSRKKMVEGTIQNIINFYQGKITIKN